MTDEHHYIEGDIGNPSISIVRKTGSFVLTQNSKRLGISDMQAATLSRFILNDKGSETVQGESGFGTLLFEREDRSVWVGLSSLGHPSAIRICGKQLEQLPHVLLVALGEEKKTQIFDGEGKQIGEQWCDLNGRRVAYRMFEQTKPQGKSSNNISDMVVASSLLRVAQELHGIRETLDTLTIIQVATLGDEVKAKIAPWLGVDAPKKGKDDR